MTMKAEDRRNRILETLSVAARPVSAASLAADYSVSRQIIVGDIALLRAGGYEIAATPRGYIIPKNRAVLTYRIATRHENEDMETEMNAIVDEGCTIHDVIVEHPIYGQITGLIDASSRRDVSDFVGKCKEHPESLPLSALTNGIHLHTILCPTEQAYRNVCTALTRLGFLLDE